MYLPDHFKMEKPEAVQDLILKYPLGTLISSAEDSIQVNYLPFYLEGNFLFGHMAKANPQLPGLHGNRVIVSFQGPSRYISPSWYQSSMQVPTWNYAVVEVHGQAEVQTEFMQVEEILQKSVVLFEKQNNTAWDYNLPERFRTELVKHIVGIKIDISQIEAKFKLSQNRNPVDRESVRAHLAQSLLTEDLAMLELMKKL